MSGDTNPGESYLCLTNLSLAQSVKWDVNTLGELSDKIQHSCPPTGRNFILQAT